MGPSSYVKETSLDLIVGAVILGGEREHLVCFIVIVGRSGWWEKQLVFHNLLMSLKHFD